MKRQANQSYSADWPDDEVRPVSAWCKSVGLSLATGRRVIAKGQGPVSTYLSPRRKGIRGRHNRSWLDQRASKTNGGLVDDEGQGV